MMLEIVCQGAPNHQNEDAFVAYQRDDGQPRYVLGAIDGATSVAPFVPLQFYLDQKRNGITPAALAATITRDAILAQLGSFSSNEDIDPCRLILGANNALRTLLDEVAPGIFSAEEIRNLQPSHSHLLDDPRKIRLFLPAAVLTLITVDTQVNLLRFAHAGDTSLLICYEDGHVAEPTLHPERMNYESALVTAGRLLLSKGVSMLDAINDPAIRALDRDQRIYHNYVDEQGHAVDGRGVGVVNGLPELKTYLEIGMIILEKVAAVLVISDGFLWPSSLHETPNARRNRLERMWAHIRQAGLQNYLAALRAEERSDANREKYPRFKLHDDATAVLLWLKEYL